ncbi:hypothetical protein PV797_01960 [Clostridiaceae bacterium M8S5]|nr:hypothetical protein PV797_01960 [Clostridiaceae bacterium M8S5]
MTKQNLNIKQVLGFGGAFIGFSTGAGFSSGQEILQFFTCHGFKSLPIVIISAVIFIWCVNCLLEKGRVLKLENSSDVYKYYCGKYIGTFFQWFILIFLFSAMTIMISGGGATIYQYYGLPSILGRCIIGILVLISVLSGLDRLIQIMGKLGPFIAITALFVGGMSILDNIDGLRESSKQITLLSVPKATSSWLFSGFLYPSYTIVAITPFLTSIGKNAESKKTTFLSALWSGIVLMLAVLMLNLGMLAYINNVYNKPIPVLVLAKKLIPALGAGFSIILVLGMFSTSTAMMWSICSKFANEGTKKYKIIATALLIVAFAAGSLPFEKLISIVYPITGYMGLILIVGMLYRTYINNKYESL